MTQITPQPGIMDIALYQGGAAHVDGVSNTVKLSSNENPLGPSPRAIEAMREAAATMHRLRRYRPSAVAVFAVDSISQHRHSLGGAACRYPVVVLINQSWP